MRQRARYQSRCSSASGRWHQGTLEAETGTNAVKLRRAQSRRCKEADSQGCPGILQRGPARARGSRRASAGKTRTAVEFLSDGSCCFKAGKLAAMLGHNPGHQDQARARSHRQQASVRATRTPAIGRRYIM